MDDIRRMEEETKRQLDEVSGCLEETGLSTLSIPEGDRHAGQFTRAPPAALVPPAERVSVHVSKVWCQVAWKERQ